MYTISKSFQLLLSLVFILLFSSNAMSQCPLDIGETTNAPTQDLTLYFPFDGNVDNLGDSAYSATLSGANFVNTECGLGLEFDGLDDHVAVTPSLWLANDYTITTWITPSDFPSGFIFGVEQVCPTTWRRFSQVEFSANNNVLRNTLNRRTDCWNYGNKNLHTSSPSGIVDSARYFVAMTVVNNDNLGRTVRFYVNCVELGSTLTLGGTHPPYGVIFDAARVYKTTIGAMTWAPGTSGSGTYNGIIDDFRLYESALSTEQIESVYRSCLPITASMERFSDCETDSAEIKLAHSELDVTYQLFDITNGVFINPALPGNCDTLVFNTPLVYDTTQYQIVAIHNNSPNCSLNMDSIFTIHPESHTFYGNMDVTICYGDSLLVNNDYVYNSGIYSDTIEYTPFCDSVITITLTELPNGLVDFEQTDTSGCCPIDVSFTNTSIIPAPMIIDTWEWDFGDGGVSTLENPIHTYATWGTFDVSLTITTIDGCVFDTAITTVYQDEICTNYPCGKNDQKVEICHVPAGNPANEQTLCVSPSAVPAHLAHGDYCGPCLSAANKSLDSNEEISVTEESVTIYPNPSVYGNFTLKFNGFGTTKYIEISDISGKVILKLETLNDEEYVNLTENSKGIYFVTVSDGTLEKTKRVIIE